MCVSSTSYYWHVCSTQTGDALFEYSGASDSSSAGTDVTGTKAVSISDNDAHALVESFAGGVEQVPLPANCEVIENGNKIRLTWPSGETEERGRKTSLEWAKWGRTSVLLPLVNPPAEAD